LATILNINTAFERATVGLSVDGNIIAEKESDSQKDHASFLQPAIQKICNGSNISLQNINAVSVINGPGSYTGLRVGLSSAKALCYALDKPLILLNSLDVMAYALKTQSGETNNQVLFCPLIDAKRMEVYTALYNFYIKPVKNYAAEILNNNFLVEERKNKKIIAGGNGSLKWKEIIGDSNVIFINPLQLSIPAVILSENAFNSEKFSSIAYSEPFYLKQVYFRK
jgi:tRNA threonylcarbamoyladenosine biosynthesis protein TsaB